MLIILTIPLAYLFWQALTKPRIIITHRETFTLGFIWYAAMPLYFANVDLSIESPALVGWRAIATIMGAAVQSIEILWATGIWLAFMMGCALTHRRAALAPLNQPSSPQSVAGWKAVLLAVGAAAILFALTWAGANRALLFRGYAFEYDDVIRGPLQGAIVYASVAAVIAYAMSKQIGRMPLILLVTAILSLIILSLSVGTRSMVLLSVLMLAALISKIRNGLPRIPLILGGLATVAVFGALAAWRQGTGDLGFALLSAALEPLYTYISAATYLAFNDPPLIAMPVPLVGSLVNLVPRAVWPDKIDYLASLMEGVRIYAPLGATHLFPSLLMNFGWLGGIIAAACAGAGIERLSQSRRPTLTASYILIVAVLAADIWRNPFSQSLVKSVLQGGILVPLLMAFAAAVLAQFRGRVAASAPSDFSTPQLLPPAIMPRSASD